MKLIFFGSPGSGKGTYASRLSAKFNIPHISTGDIFRGEVSVGSELGEKTEIYLSRGQLVPDKIVIEIVKERLKQKDCKRGFILDGFPRTIPQAEALERITKIDAVLYFKWPKDVLIKKALARRTCEKCGAIYNIADIKSGKFRFPPLLPKKKSICDKCGGKLIKRKDDTLKVVKERIQQYNKQTKPLIQFYKKKQLLKIVNVVGSPDIMMPIISEVVLKSVKLN